MIEYYGPRQLQKNIEAFVEEKILPYIARTENIPFYIGKLAGISMKPTPHFLFDEEKNKTIENALDTYLEGGDSEKERIYKEVRSLCVAASSLPRNFGGAHQKDIDNIVFSPHHLLDYIHISSVVPESIDWDVLQKEKPEEWEYYMNGLNFPHSIAHEIIHWDLGEIVAYRELREAFLLWKKIVQDPRLMEGNFHEIVNEALANNNPHGVRYSKIWEKIWNLGLYDFNEVIAECIGFAIVPTPNGRIYISVEAPDEIVDNVHKKLRDAGIKETLAFAKQFMDDAYRTETPIYDLLRRA